MKKQVIEVGQLHEVEFLPSGSNNKKPIARIEGRVCFIHKNNVENVKVGETWNVAISEVHDRFLIVMPVYIQLSVEETESKKQKILEALRKKAPNCKKTKKYFVFKNFKQLQQIKKQP